jgi:putative salt-induced outer membrane protein YdiY
MKKYPAILSFAAGVLMGFSFSAAAQTTNIYTVTNVVTVLVTNIVTLTNVMAATPTQADVPALAAPVKTPWQSSIAAGLTLTRGNSDTLLVTGSLLTEKKDKIDEWSFGADGGYGENEGEKNVDSAHLFGQFNHLFSEKFYGYLRLNALHDGISDLRYRVTGGPGVGYYLLKETNTTLAVEAGSAIVFEQLGDQNTTYATLRLADRFEYKFSGQRARAWQTVEILPQVDAFNNYNVNAEVGIETAISKKLSLQTFVVDNYINEPAAGRQKNDVKLVSGMKYKF